MSVADLYDQALELPEAERVALALRLVRSVDPDEHPSREWMEAWSGELEERVRASRAGELESVGAREALAELRTRLNER